MKENDIVLDLILEIRSTRKVLTKIDSFYNEFINNELKLIGKNKVSAIVMAEIFVDFYTCLETLFLKVSQFYGNNLQKEKWHTELLHKMTLEIGDIRLPVISDETSSILHEFMKFRHFRRYYFEFDYDWDKLDFLENKYNQVKRLLENDLKIFEGILEKIR